MTRHESSKLQHGQILLRVEEKNGRHKTLLREEIYPGFFSYYYLHILSGCHYAMKTLAKQDLKPAYWQGRTSEISKSLWI